MLPVYPIHYNAPDWVRGAAMTILASEPPVRLTVISNSGPIEVRNARVIDTGRNGGYTGGANVAIRDGLANDEPFAVIGSHDLHVESDTFALLRPRCCAITSCL